MKMEKFYTELKQAGGLFYDSEMEGKPFFRKRQRNLPHWEKSGAIYFITFRLAGSLPISVIQSLQEEYERRIKAARKDSVKNKAKVLKAIKDDLAKQIDDYLDKNIHVRYLANPRIAKLVQDAIFHFAIIATESEEANETEIATETVALRDKLSGRSSGLQPRYILFRWVIMPNHVHLIIKPLVNPETGEDFPLEKILHSIKSFTGHQANKILNRSGQFWQHESYDHIIRNEKEFINKVLYIDYNPVKAGLCENPEDWEWSSAYWLFQCFEKSV